MWYMDDDVDEVWPTIRTSRMDTRVIGAVHGAHHAIAERLGQATRVHGLDASESLVLVAIQRDQGCAPWEIRRRIGLHRSTLSSILDRLERDGLILRLEVGGGRRFDIRLTSAGRIAADLADYAVASVESEIAGYTSREERQAAVAVFEACVAVGRRERGVSD